MTEKHTTIDDLAIMVKRGFDSVEGRMALKSDLDAIEKKMALKSDLDAIEKKMALKSDIDAIEKKMALKSDIDAIEKKMALKSDLEAAKEDFKRYTSILAESFDHKLQLVAEAVFGIQEQLVAIRDMVMQNTEDIKMMKIDIQLIKQEFKQKVDREEFNILERRVLALETKTSTSK